MIEARYYLAWLGQKMPLGKKFSNLALFLGMACNLITFFVIQYHENMLYGIIHIVLGIVFCFFFVSFNNNFGIIRKFD